MLPPVKRPYDLLTLHGWRPVTEADYVLADKDDGGGWWLHPHNKELRPGPPPPAYTTREAVAVQLLNDRVELLREEGWEEDMAEVYSSVAWDHGAAVVTSAPYLRSVGKMHLPSSTLRDRSVAHAFSYQRGLGWPKALERLEALRELHRRAKRQELPAPVRKAILDLRQGVLVTWCSYCEQWHREDVRWNEIAESCLDWIVDKNPDLRRARVSHACTSASVWTCEPYTLEIALELGAKSA